MKKNSAIVDCTKKVLTIVFNGEEHVVDLREGDLHDNWNSIQDNNDVVWDINFSWEDTKGEKPYLSIYALEDADENGCQSTKWDDYTSIKVKAIGNRDIYFKEDRFKYRFDSTSSLTFRVYDQADNLLFKTKSLNRASDFITNHKWLTRLNSYMVATDSNGATKKI